MDISANVSAGTTVSWTPAVIGNPVCPTVTATDNVAKYNATVNMARNNFDLPDFFIICLSQAVNLRNDTVTTDEDREVIVAIYSNDMFGI